MPGIRRFSKSIRKLDNIKENVQQEFPGVLGCTFKGTKYVDVPNRDGYVYVRLRSNLNEVIQAYNSTVSPVYDLPVLVKRDKTFERFIISGRDLGRYTDWGSSSYLPRHGAQHSFPQDKYGGDVVWVYDRQFVPLSIRPSGAYGANNVFVNGDILYWDGSWLFAGDTGTTDLFTYKPTGTYAKMVLVYIDSYGNPAVSPGPDMFDWSATGLSQIIPYLPTLSTTQGIPLGAVRLVSGTSRITWNEIYDLRPLLNQANWSSPYQAQDEGVTLPRRSYMNFKGVNIWASDNAGDDSTDISFSGTSAQDGHTIMEGGAPFTQRPNLNFIGGTYVGIMVQDNPALDSTDVIITGTYTIPIAGHYILWSYPLYASGTVFDIQEEMAYEDWLDFRGNSVLSVTDAEESPYWATEINISGTHVLQQSQEPTGTFPGMLWLKPEAGAGAMGMGHIIESDGVPLPLRTYLDFSGDLVTTTDSPGSDKTSVAIGESGFLNERIVAKVYDVCMHSGTTNLITCPLDTSLFVTRLLLMFPTASMAGGGCFNFTDWMQNVSLEALTTATEDWLMIDPGNTRCKRLYDGEVFQMTVVTGTSATCYADLWVFGYYIAD